MEREARRGAGADPVVTGTDTQPTSQRARGIHCLAIPTPFAVGRVNCYLIEDDPLTLVDCRAELGQGARRARARAGRARPADRGPRAHLRHPPAHRPPRARRDHRPALERRGRRTRHTRPRDRGVRGRCRARRRARRVADAAPWHPARRGRRAALDVALVPRLGRLGAGVADGARRRGARVRRPHDRPSCTGPATPHRTRCLWDEQRALMIGGDHLIKHISSNPLISRPLGGSRASRAVGARAR